MPSSLPAKTNKSPRTVRIAIIGTGGMANRHAEVFEKVKGCKVVAACDIDRARVEAFCASHGIKTGFTSVDALLEGADFDAVSVVTPDAFHASVTLQCLKAGKHVLCEKPLALHYPDARKMLNAARKAGVIHMVNFSYRDWSAIQAVARAVARGDIGELRHVEASYLQAWLPSKIWGDWRTDPKWLWRLSNAHGSKGVLGDVGVHIVDFATFPAGPIRKLYCQLKSFPKAPGDRIGDYVLDANDSAVMNVEFANGALGTIHTSRWVGGHANRLFLKLAGTLGTIEIDSDRSTQTYRVCRGANLDTCVWEEILADPTPNNYQRFVTAIRKGVQDQPDFARGAEIQRVLDSCFESDAADAPIRLLR